MVQKTMIPTTDEFFDPTGVYPGLGTAYTAEENTADPPLRTLFLARKRQMERNGVCGRARFAGVEGSTRSSA